MRILLSIVTTGVLLVPPNWAQQVSGPQSKLVQESGGLKIVVVQGEGAVNNIRTKTATAPVVEVRDQQDKPVAGAEVIFQLPAAGPGGVFNGWMRNQTARTNAEGQAGASGYAPNDEEGRFNIKVTATQGTKTASLVISQVNSRSAAGGPQATGKKSHKGWWVLAAVALGGIVGGTVAATHGGSSSSTPSTTPVSITPGPITIGGPR